MKPKIVMKIRMIKNISDIDREEKSHEGKKVAEICGSRDSWVSLWRKRQDYVMAGISTDNVIAIAGLTCLDKSLHIRCEDFAVFVHMFLSNMFMKENVLSCICGEEKGSVFCHFLVFPLSNRQLTPEPWIDSRTLELKFSIMEEYIQAAGKQFGIDMADNKNVSNGHTAYLDNFPLVTTSKEDIQEVFYTTITEDSQMQTDYPKDRIQSISNDTIKYFTTGVEKGSYLKLNSHDITIDQYLSEVRNFLQRMYPDMSIRDLEIVTNKVRSAAVGFYLLDDLINDPRISDIKIVSPSKIRVKVEGKRMTSNLQFIDTEDYYRFLDGIIMRYELDPDKEIHVFTDTETSDKFILRNNITLSGINSGYPTYHIRKIPKTKYKLEDLISYGVLDRTVANYLIWAAREAKGILFTGKGSSGKTTLMNTLLEYTSYNDAVLVLQETEEMFSNRPEITFEHIIPGYDLKELAKNGLLTDIDYFIVGEVKGEEAMYFINACDTGNKAWCSIHSPSSVEAINKMADYVMYASKYNQTEAKYMLKELQVIIFMKNFRVEEISEVTGWDDDRKDLTYRTVFKRNGNIG